MFQTNVGRRRVVENPHGPASLPIQCDSEDRAGSQLPGLEFGVDEVKGMWFITGLKQ